MLPQLWHQHWLGQPLASAMAMASGCLGYSPSSMLQPGAGAGMTEASSRPTSHASRQEVNHWQAIFTIFIQQYKEKE